jgi:hypothetical protein
MVSLGAAFYSVHVGAGGWTPVFSTHHLPTTLRSLTFADVQMSDAHVFFRGRDVLKCLSLHWSRAGWSFASQLPDSVTHLRLMSDGDCLLKGLEMPKTCSNLEELDIDVVDDYYTFWKVVRDRAESLGKALASLSVKRVGLHSSAGCPTLYIPNVDVAQMHRSFYIGRDRYPSPLEHQVDRDTRGTITKLTLYLAGIPSWPHLLGCSSLRELVIGDAWTDDQYDIWMPFSLKGLEVVASTLRHLTVSSSRQETYVELPKGLRLRSSVCVCSGTLILHCDPHTVGPGLEDILLGYTTLSGTGSGLVEELAPRLQAAVLVVPEFHKLKQCLLFTRAGLVGEWWHGVFQPSKQQILHGCWCCRVRVWAHGSLCPSHVTFPRYGIVSVHDDRDVLWGDRCWALDEAEDEKVPVYPDWHYTELQN